MSGNVDCNIIPVFFFYIKQVMDLESIFLSFSTFQDEPQCSESLSSFAQIALSDLTSLIGKMKLSTCSEEILSSSLLVQALTCIGPTVLVIINSSLNHWYVSFYLKMAHDPIFKET